MTRSVCDLCRADIPEGERHTWVHRPYCGRCCPNGRLKVDCDRPHPERGRDVLDRLNDEPVMYHVVQRMLGLLADDEGDLQGQATREIERLREGNAALRTALERLLDFVKGYATVPGEWERKRLKEDVEAAERALAEGGR